jgi:hypothetical protein
MLENGTCATSAEIATAEKINETYVGRVLRLTLLAPDVVEAILNGRQPAQVTLAGLSGGLRWDGGSSGPRLHVPIDKSSRRGRILQLWAFGQSALRRPWRNLPNEPPLRNVMSRRDGPTADINKPIGPNCAGRLRNVRRISRVGD